jgi:pimeloyl-ACP methyl ester carboxylesterase
MADFVLVHGAWHGAWAWRRILPALWRAGHRAFPVSLTGVGERAHLLAPDLSLETHIQDVTAVLDAEELEDCVLVGHSYAGMVITGAADRRPERIGRLVYVDAVLPRPGEAWSTGHPEAVQAERRAHIRATGVLPPPDPAVFGLAGADRDWVARRLTPQPGGVYDAPLAFDQARWRAWPRTYIDCHAPALASMAAMRVRARQEPGWVVRELATGHDPMISAPAELVAALLAEA